MAMTRRQVHLSKPEKTCLVGRDQGDRGEGRLLRCLMEGENMNPHTTGGGGEKTLS